jgi:LmbE family N-acetylglucosaminyl deacetylase
MKIDNRKSVAVIVAHPDDETLWAGGTILSHPEWDCFVVCLSRSRDTDRAPKFYISIKQLNADGIMGDLDDGPEQHLLDPDEIESTILNLLPILDYDIIITHNASGEYTRHVRHEEVNRAVFQLWETKQISTKEIWTFAYEDGNATYFPKAIETATQYDVLPEPIWQQKYSIITETYAFEKHSWEAETTPLAEAFWQFKEPTDGLRTKSTFENKITVSKSNIFRLLTKKNYSFLFQKNFWNFDIYSRRNTGRAHWLKSRKKLHYFIPDNELKIFKPVNIESFKQLYSKSIAHVLNPNKWYKNLLLLPAFLYNISLGAIVKTIMGLFSSEPKIFSRPSIRKLKTNSFRNGGLAFEKNNWKTEVSGKTGSSEFAAKD